MSFFKDLFASKPKPTYEHPILGTLQALSLNGENTTWSTTWEVLSEPVALSLNGTEQAPSSGSIRSLESIVATQTILETAKAAVLDTLRNADEAYPTEHFDCDMRLVAISIYGPGSFEISYEQRNDPFYHFNAQFMNGEVDCVSVDS